MTDAIERVSYLSPEKQAVLAIKRMQSQLASVEGSLTEPIAIIGMGCRFPGGANHPEAFWNLLHKGVDAIKAFPAEARPAFHGEGPSTRWMGGILDQVEYFDAAFFGISPREAAEIDPQQRLFLEVAWEAVESAGLTLQHLRTGLTGVFVGISTNDYLHLQMQEANPALQSAYIGTGNSHSFSAGRLSYLLDLKGPSLAIDTVCSSSLVAVHLACQSLRLKESHVALVGAVNLILSPTSNTMLSGLQALSKTGHCKTFDAQADGFVRGEGCGVVILKRLSDALANGDTILALIRGSAVNQDGHSTSLTAPNMLSQEEVLRQALANARLRAEQISYIETHGSATMIGDPIEVEALCHVYGTPRLSGLSCTLGAVKTNIGHLEAAAGMAGIIKTVLALQHRLIPPNLHFQTLNPHISLDGTSLKLATELCPWKTENEPRYAGVSAFGLSGTNAHIILEEAPTATEAATNALSIVSLPQLLTLSARSFSALYSLIQTYQSWFTQLASVPELPPLIDICYTASLRRSHHQWRAAFVADSRQGMAEQIQLWLATHSSIEPSSASFAPAMASRKKVFVFSGEGSTWMRMGRQLLQHEPVFRSTIEQCGRLMQPFLGLSLLDELQAGAAHSRLDDISIGHPALFAIQVALFDLWVSWGIEPDAVVGHSRGEIAAAYAAGILSLADAVRVICLRSQLLTQIQGQGKMLQVDLSVAEAWALIAEGSYTDVWIAAINSPSSLILAGSPEELRHLQIQLQQLCIPHGLLEIKVACHCRHVEPLLLPLKEALAPIQPGTACRPFYSTVTGTLLLENTLLDADYWVQNLRVPVQFTTAVGQLLADGYTTFIEVSGHPALLSPIYQQAQLLHTSVTLIASLRRTQHEHHALRVALAALYEQGTPISWSSLITQRGRCIPLPLYPWQREFFWQPEYRLDTRHASIHEVPPAYSVEVLAPDNLLNPSSSPIQTSHIYDEVMQLSTEKRYQFFEQYSTLTIAKILKCPLEKLDKQRPLHQLGLDSLMAQEIRNQVESALRVKLSVANLLASASVADIVKQILAEVLLHTLETPVALLPLEVNVDAYRLSDSQEALWFLHQLASTSSAYHVVVALHVLSSLEPTVLQHCLQILYERHAILRTTYALRDDVPFQFIHAQANAPLLEVDASSWSETSLLDEMAREAHKPFDLTQNVLRTTLFKRSQDDNYLLLVFHHIAIDFWSVVVFLDELQMLYTATTMHQRPIELPPLPLRYIDYTNVQRHLLAGPSGEQQRNYWHGQLLGEHPVLDLPTDHPRPPVQTYRGATCSFEVTEALTDQLKALAQEEGVTLYVILLATFEVLLHRYAAQEAFLIGTASSGRSRLEYSSLVGNFFNSLVLRANFSENPSFKEIILRVRQTVLQAIEHQDYPFSLLVKELQPERDPSRSPLFQVMFIFDQPQTNALQDISQLLFGHAGTQVHFGDLLLEPCPLPNHSARLDLSLTMVDAHTKLFATFEYNTDLFDTATIARMVDHFLVLLQSITVDKDCKVVTLPLLTPTEQQVLLYECNATYVALPEHANTFLIQHVFEVQAESMPDAIAVVYENSQITYQALNRRANQLAHYLQQSSIQSDSIVGLCTSRSIDMLVGLLGILKAGVAYLPLDPTYPRERLSFMLHDAGVTTVVTQATLIHVVSEQHIHAIFLDKDWPALTTMCDTNPTSNTLASCLAYVIYTSGSTGKPKGVMVTHANVMNFLTAMDKDIQIDTHPTWLAVTGISFDISVLEVLWTLTRGFKVVVLADLYSRQTSHIAHRQANVDFSLFYFAKDDSEHNSYKYNLLLEGARFADQNGFSAVWTPERHFHEFGGIYANPAITSAAIASITKQIHIRAGSVVLPLHNPIRVAEEWSMIDNLSHGRVGISFAPGWNAHDFVLAPNNYAQRKQIMSDGIETVRKLWRGETLSYRDGTAEQTPIRLLPRPLQAELPVWITAAGNPDTFRFAGEIGANILTHLLGQSMDDLAKKIALYRRTWHEHGHGPGNGYVTIMLHTFISTDINFVREKVYHPFSAYLKSSLDLMKNLAQGYGIATDPQALTEEDKNFLVAYGFDRYFSSSALFGTPETCLEMVSHLKAQGVDEIACLIDFGIDSESVLTGLQYLNELRSSFNQSIITPALEDYSFSSQVRRHAVSHFQCTPSLAQLLVKDHASLEALSTLKILLLGGEPLPISLAQELGPRKIGAIFNMYGPTETTIWSSTSLVEPHTETITIGRPIANTAMYLLDQYLQPVPFGLPGELYIAGAGVVRGYHKRPELSAERFLPDPFCGIPGARMYRTGDLARYLPHRAIEFIKRVDHQVKIRGYRIELAEIEQVLAQHRDVQEAVVTIQTDVAGNASLVASVVPNAQSQLDFQQLHTFLKAQLPAYMLPSRFILLDTIPLTPNGKRDRLSLATLQESQQTQVPLASLPPQTNREAVLIAIWSEVLRQEQIDPEANFFDLGGHSLLAIQVLARIRRHFQVDLPLQTFFETPTIAALTALLDTQKSVPQKIKYPSLKRVSRDEPHTSSFGQNRIWFMQQMDPDDAFYNTFYAIHLQGSLNRAALVQSCNKIMQRHEVLRTMFSQRNGQLIQTIENNTSFSFQVIDIQALSSSIHDTLVHQLIEMGIDIPFDLDRAPLAHLYVFQVSPDEHILLLIMHHIISDGWSINIFIQELATHYNAFSCGLPSPLSPLTFQYADYAAWQKQWLQEEILTEQLNYWKQHLKNAPELINLPIDHPRQTKQASTGAFQPIHLSSTLTHALKALSQAEGTTLFMTIMAAFVTLLHFYSNEDDIIVGTDVSNRPLKELEDLIGFFVNQFALRCICSNNPSFSQLLAQVRQNLLQAYAHQDLPFEKLVEVLQHKRSLSYRPVFQVLFVMQAPWSSPPSFSGLQMHTLEVTSKKTKYDLILDLAEDEGHLVGRLEYNATLFEAGTVQHIAAHLEAILQEITVQKDIRLSALKRLLSSLERQQRGIDAQEIRMSHAQKLKKLKQASNKDTYKKGVTL